MLYKHKNIAYNEPYNLLNNFTRTAKKNWRTKKVLLMTAETAEKKIQTYAKL